MPEIDWESVNEWLKEEIRELLEDDELTDEEQEALYNLTDERWSELADEFVRLYSEEFREEFIEALREKLREIAHI